MANCSFSVLLVLPLQHQWGGGRATGAHCSPCLLREVAVAGGAAGKHVPFTILGIHTGQAASTPDHCGAVVASGPEWRSRSLTPNPKAAQASHPFMGTCKQRESLKHSFCKFLSLSLALGCSSQLDAVHHRVSSTVLSPTDTATCDATELLQRMRIDKRDKSTHKGLTAPRSFDERCCFVPQPSTSSTTSTMIEGASPLHICTTHPSKRPCRRLHDDGGGQQRH